MFRSNVLLKAHVSLFAPRTQFRKMNSSIVNIDDKVEQRSLKSNKTADYKVITEGSAEIEVEKRVFYNPVQEFNRDLSIAVLNQYAASVDGGITILEALSATGLRSVRYAKEVNNVRKIVANDLAKSAVETIERNVVKNNVAHLVDVKNFDAIDLMHLERKEKYHVIDLDPYGCPAMYLDSAVRCVKDNGLLLVTATDMAVLAGNSPESCYVKYGSISLKMKSCHEMALRILLQTIQAHANRYGRYIEPILSISADFYIRVFVKVASSPLQCKLSTSKLALVYHCTTCGTFSLQPMGHTREENKNIKYLLPFAPVVGPNCSICNQHHKLGGPIWINPLHDCGLLKIVLENDKTKTLATWPRIKGMLSMILEELPGCPLYYSLPTFCSALHVITPPVLKIRSAILNAGYSVSLSHCLKDSIKTNAPAQFLWAMLCQFAHDNDKRFIDDSISSQIFRNCFKPDVYTIDFSYHPASNPVTRKERLLRFQTNPLPNWGPGTRSTVMIAGSKCPHKKRRIKSPETDNMQQ